jgi:hypothetical protein
MQARTPLLALALALAGTTVAGAAVSSHSVKAKPVPTTVVNQSAQQLRTSVQQAATLASVHVVWSTSYGNHVYRNTADVSQLGGLVTIESSVGKSKGTASAVLTPTTAYLRGDVFSLRSTFNFSASGAAKYAGKWLSFTSKQPLYRTIASTATFSSIIASMSLRAPFMTLRASTIGATPVVGIRGIAAGPSDSSIGEGQTITIYLSTDTGLPVRVLPVSNASSSWSLNFSSWGEPVVIVEPSGAIASAGIQESFRFDERQR